jgi:hypothetical protein
MLARQVLRELTVKALKAANTLAEEHVYVHDWPTNYEANPIAILFNRETDHKISNGRTVPNFTSSPAFHINFRVQAKSVIEARKKMDSLLSQAEQAIFTNLALSKIVQQFPYVTTEGSITSESEYHIAEATMIIAMEIFELFQIDPSTLVDLKEIDVDVDLVNRFDATGTYNHALFPEEVVPAPRAHGPDGRAEGTLKITNLDK